MIRPGAAPIKTHGIWIEMPWDLYESHRESHDFVLYMIFSSSNVNKNLLTFMTQLEYNLRVDWLLKTGSPNWMHVILLELIMIWCKHNMN